MESPRKSSSKKEEYVKNARELNADQALFHKNVEDVEEEELSIIGRDQ